MHPPGSPSPARQPALGSPGGLWALVQSAAITYCLTQHQRLGKGGVSPMCLTRWCTSSQRKGLCTHEHTETLPGTGDVGGQRGSERSRDVAHKEAAMKGRRPGPRREARRGCSVVFSGHKSQSRDRLRAREHSISTIPVLHLWALGNLPIQRGHRAGGCWPGQGALIAEVLATDRWRGQMVKQGHGELPSPRF